MEPTPGQTQTTNTNLMLGTLRKMHTELDDPVRYQMVLGDRHTPLNDFLDKTITLKHTGRIFCLHCNRLIKKTYHQGYCYPCFITLAQCDSCILKPEKCHYHLGTCREPAWGEAFCFQPHIVYLANSSGIKVGITRQTQTPTRWIDQGAAQALPIFRVPSRHVSGLTEIILAQHVSDKTNWQQMLKNHAPPLPLAEKRDLLLDLCQKELDVIKQQFGEHSLELVVNEPVLDIRFPIRQLPTKIKAHCFMKTHEVSGILLGIKGQYLLLDTGVINIRKYTGFEVEFQA